MNSVNRYAVFGHPIGHSKSPLIHRAFAQQTGQDITYEAIDVPPESFEQQLEHFMQQDGHGVNCTVPLKELAFQRADQLSEAATFCGAVNTLTRMQDGQLLGDNTDGVGLIQDLTNNLGLTLTNRRILLLGAGGASRGIIGPLLGQKPTSLVIANRTKAKAQVLAEHFSNLAYQEIGLTGLGMEELPGQPAFDLIINATAASLRGDLPELPQNLLTEKGTCYDLAYGKEPTPFVRWGKAQGASVSTDGLGMLVEQAASAFEIWRGIRPNTRTVIRLLETDRVSKTA